MSIKNYLSKINLTDFTENEFFKKKLSPYELKALLLDEIVNIVNNEILESNVSEYSLIDKFEISKFNNNYWKISLFINDKNKIPLLPTSNTVYYNLSFVDSPNLYHLDIYFNQDILSNVDSVEVYIETDTQYLQFSKNLSDFVPVGDAWNMVSGNVYVYLPDIYGTLLVKFKSSGQDILNIYLNQIGNNFYFVPNLSIDLYKITDIPYFVKTVYPIFNLALSQSGEIYSYSYVTNISNSLEILSAKLKYKNFYVHKYYKTYLPYSYKDFPFLRTYVYDLALAMLVLVSQYRITEDNKYKELLINLFESSKKLLNSKNSFNFSYPSYGFYSDEYIRNGAVSWMLEALAVTYKYINDLNSIDNKNFIKSIADYLISEIQSNGLVRGGYGRYVGDNFDSQFVVPWYSTEHNVDTYFALRSVYDITQENLYLNKANSLKSAIITNLWNGQRLTQGFNDSAGALDIHTWGTIFLYKTQTEQNSIYSNFKYLDTYFRDIDFKSYLSPILYKPYSDELGYPNASNLIWFEGYFQAYYTKYLLYKQRKEFDEESKKLSFFLVKNLLPYSIGKDPIYEIGEFASLAASCWYIFTFDLINYDMESFWFL